MGGVIPDDSAVALALEREDVTGGSRARERDRDRPLAGSGTLNRLELGTLEEAPAHRHQPSGTGQDSPAADARSRMCETVPVLMPTAVAVRARVRPSPWRC